jgi:hypothetical protein
MRGFISIVLTGALVYFLHPALNQVVASLPYGASPNSALYKLAAILILLLMIYGVMGVLTKR